MSEVLAGAHVSGTRLVHDGHLQIQKKTMQGQSQIRLGLEKFETEILQKLKNPLEG